MLVVIIVITLTHHQKIYWQEVLRSIADLIGVPFVKADATKFSETGYVGADVEDLVRDVAQRLNRDERIVSYVLEAENFESIHNHSAYAVIEHDKRNAAPAA